MAWDSLTYHLFRPARWIQAGEIAAIAAPDALGYYEYFPVTGEIIWAYAMLTTRTDMYVAIAGLLVWCNCLIATYSSARILSADKIPAFLASMVVCLAAPVLEYMTSGYVASVSLAIFLLHFVFVIQTIRTGSPAMAVFSAAALGLLLGVKWTYVPIVAVSLSVLMWTILRRASALRWQMRGLILVLMLLAMSPGLLGYLHAWTDTGSPLYPLSLKIGDKTLLEGNEEVQLQLTGALFPETQFNRTRVLRAFFHPLAYRRFHLGFGPVAPFIILLGFFSGISCYFRHMQVRPGILYLFAVIFLIVWLSVSQNGRGLWINYPAQLPRLIFPVYATMTLFAAAANGRLTTVTLGLATVVALALAIPRSWATIDMLAVSLLLAYATPLFAIALLCTWWFCKKRCFRLAGLAVLVPSLLISPILTEIRQRFKYAYYESASKGEVFDVHPLAIEPVSCWPIWKFLDDQSGQYIAVTAGWDEGTNNWYCYPLLGKRYQHKVSYIPITVDGSIIDYRLSEELLAEADFLSWLKRLIAERVDYVVSLPPTTLEARWMARYPCAFVPVELVQSCSGRLYRLNHAEASTLWQAMAVSDCLS
ncbi:hypothetical protein ACFL1X_07425 [Candidatus Hydrogenedentota bacterium]